VQGDAGSSLKWVSRLKGKRPRLTRFTGVRTLLSQASPAPLSDRAWGPPSLQGLPTSGTLHTKEAWSGDEQAARAALGDAVRLNVLMRVLGKALFIAGLLDHAPFDPWQQIAKDTSHCDLRSCSLRVLPDAYVHGGGPNVR